MSTKRLVNRLDRIFFFSFSFKFLGDYDYS